ACSGVARRRRSLVGLRCVRGSRPGWALPRGPLPRWHAGSFVSRPRSRWRSRSSGPPPGRPAPLLTASRAGRHQARTKAPQTGLQYRRSPMDTTTAADDITDAIAHIETHRQDSVKMTGLATACNEALRKLHEMLHHEQEAVQRHGPGTLHPANVGALTAAID